MVTSTVVTRGLRKHDISGYYSGVSDGLQRSLTVSVSIGNLVTFKF